MQRRALLSSLTAVGTIAIAGCSNSSEPTSEAESEQELEDSERTGPEAVVERMGTALAEGNVEAANGAVHPDSPRQEYTEEAAANIIEQYDVQEVPPSKEDYIQTVAESAKNVGEESIRRSDNDVQQAVNENDFNDYSIVLSEFEGESGRFDGEPVWVVKDGDEWYVW